MGAVEGERAHWSQIAFVSAILFIAVAAAGSSAQAALALARTKWLMIASSVPCST